MEEEEIFYLVKNINGLEEVIQSGLKKELEELKAKLDLKSNLTEDKVYEETPENIFYYIIPKKEWDLENCPLFPVDFP